MADAAQIGTDIATSSQEAVKAALSEIMKPLMPFIEIIGGLIGLYLILIIIKSISGILVNRRIKRIDRNLQEITEILKKPKTKKKL